MVNEVELRVNRPKDVNLISKKKKTLINNKTLHTS